MAAQKTLKMIFSILLAAQCVFAEPAGGTPVVNQPYTFINRRIIHLRDANLLNPQIVAPNSEISLDPSFLLETFGTQNPSIEQYQRLFLNPGEVSDRIVTQSFIDSYYHDRRSDYFFPVVIRDSSGETRAGKMAIYSYNRHGHVELRQGETPQALSAPPPNASTEGAIKACSDCQTRPLAPPRSASDLAAVASTVNQSTRNSTHPLWTKYKEFAKEFSEQNRNISGLQAGHYKRLYVKSMIEKFGTRDTGIILAAITGFAEAPYRSNNGTQMAEIAAVLKVIENRTNNSFRRRSRTLSDIGVDENVDLRLSTVLANWQFSVWNDKDNNLVRILNYNPDRADAQTTRRLALAFEAQNMMNTGKIEFLGQMNDSRLQHYHANYVLPNWAQASRKVGSPIVKVDGTEVDLSRQKGSSHVFYAGVP